MAERDGGEARGALDGLPDPPVDFTNHRREVTCPVLRGRAACTRTSMTPAKDDGRLPGDSDYGRPPPREDAGARVMLDGARRRRRRRGAETTS